VAAKVTFLAAVFESLTLAKRQKRGWGRHAVVL
jgi:hypothetical protein